MHTGEGEKIENYGERRIELTQVCDAQTACKRLVGIKIERGGRIKKILKKTTNGPDESADSGRCLRTRVLWGEPHGRGGQNNVRCPSGTWKGFRTNQKYRMSVDPLKKRKDTKTAFTDAPSNPYFYGGNNKWGGRAKPHHT